ncbi:MAG: Na+/H+ antiporter NhaA [Psychromonas sp.]
MNTQKWQWIHNPITGGMLLVVAAIIAIFWANILPENYHHFWHNTVFEVSPGYSKVVHSISFHNIANEFLMAIFFFFIGLEIKRELLAGDLSTPQKAALPIFAALGGVIFPAGIYILFNAGTESANGWGIPMATDIAFALGVLAIVGSRAPVTLKVFLSALAIGDDLMAVIVIAIFYTEQIFFSELVIGLLGIIFLVIANHKGVRSSFFYYTVGLIVVWISFLASGVHATIAGVAVAFTIPCRREISMDSYLNQSKALLKGLEHERLIGHHVLSAHAIQTLNQVKILSDQAANPLQSKEASLHPISTLFIVPFFALGNAGVIIDSAMVEEMTNPIVLGIAIGLVLGKPIGIVLFTKILTMSNLGQLPKGVTWSHIFGVGLLAGMGFTMSLFITDLAFINPEHQVIAKVSVLMASVISGVTGYLFLMRLPAYQADD